MLERKRSGSHHFVNMLLEREKTTPIRTHGKITLDCLKGNNEKILGYFRSKMPVVTQTHSFTILVFLKKQN